MKSASGNRPRYRQRYQAEIAAAEEKLLVQQSQLEETDHQLREISADASDR